MTKVINSPCAASRARVDCVPYSSQSGFIDKPCGSQSTCARVRVREGLSPIRDHEAYFRAWRVAKFGGDFDPIRIAVDEAALAFSSGKSEKGLTIRATSSCRIQTRSAWRGLRRRRKARLRSRSTSPCLSPTINGRSTEPGA